MGEASERSKVKFFEVLYADLTESSNFNYYVVVSTFVFFNINAWMVLPRIAPNSAKLTPAQLWKWRNIANSLVHSVLSGSWAIFNLWKTPELSHAYTAYTLSSLSCISFSVGYFIYDFFDMASNHRTRSTCELLIHHSLVTLCLGVSIVTRYYHGYAQIALLVEINSIFLHIRQLLIIQGWNKDNASYKINSYLNLSTFIVFRLLNLVWLIRWLAVHRSEVSFGVTTIAYTAFAQIFFLAHSLRLFKKILISDGFLKPYVVTGGIDENGSTATFQKSEIFSHSKKDGNRGAVHQSADEHYNDDIMEVLSHWCDQAE